MAKENPNLTILRQLIEDQGTKAGRQGDAALGALGAGVAKVKSTAKFDLLSGKAARESAGLGDRTLSAISGRKGAAGAATKDIPKKLLELLKQGKYKEAIKTPAGATGIAALLPILFEMILSKGQKTAQQFGEIGVQEKALSLQENANPEDIYYQSQLPQLEAEKKQAQDVLLQTVLGGRGQQIPVPGERTIGG